METKAWIWMQPEAEEGIVRRAFAQPKAFKVGKLIYDAARGTLTFDTSIILSDHPGTTIFSEQLKDIKVVGHKFWWIRTMSGSKYSGHPLTPQYSLEIKGKTYNLKFYPADYFWVGIYRGLKWKPILLGEK